ncbi:extracellular solute-binding protein [candidate division KSB3 bacterium]|uniref:Extracellular solute-binding protein n=1 Tax=candidate division KSB3 bacterium TaxID=2044937 RepID=A0A9D5Q726_9BACT|nr:extracellular solute-binding protein [candidate division KSB3 bacterium]MBD3326415.1 extracellular solute-binding protein [candidate division KSB3 bacterium]
MKRGMSILVSLLMVLAFGLSAANAQKPFEDVEITTVVHSGHHATPWYDEAEAIKEQYGITLTVIEVTPDELYSRVVLELTQGTGAYDLVQYNSAWIGDYEPYLLPLDKYVEQDNDAIGFADILPAFNEAQNLWGGKKMSITVDGDTFLFYYRQDLFQHPGEQADFKAKYGYDLPDPPQTWQQVVDLAEFFTRKEGELLAGQPLLKNFYGYADQAKRGRVYYWYLFRFAPFNAPNPHYFDPDTMEPYINSEGSIAALENMKELMQYSPPGVLSWEWDELYTAAMKDASVCMWIHWTDEGRAFNRLAPLPIEDPLEPKLGIAPTPGVEVDEKIFQYTIVDSAWVDSITKDSENPDAAYAVLKHMFGKGPVNLKHIMNPTIGWDPFRYSHFNSDVWREEVPGIEHYLQLEMEALENGYPMLKIPGAFEYNDVLDLNVSKFLAGDIDTAKEALDTVAQRWNELNEKFGVDKQKGFYAKMWQ